MNSGDCPIAGGIDASSLFAYNLTGNLIEKWGNELQVCFTSKILSIENYDLICFMVSQRKTVFWFVIYQNEKGIIWSGNQFGIFQCFNYTSKQFMNSLSQPPSNSLIQLNDQGNNYFNFGASFSPSPVGNNLAFWISDMYGFGVYLFPNVSNPNSFLLNRVYQASSTVYGIDFDNVKNLLYVGIGNTLQIFDVANYTNPILLFSYQTNNSGKTTVHLSFGHRITIIIMN